MRQLLVAIAASSLLGGCTYSIHQASVGGLEDVPKGAQLSRIKAEATEHVVLGIGSNTEYVDRAWRRLQAQCQTGKVLAVESRQTTAHGFLSYDEEIHLTGLCLDGQGAEDAGASGHSTAAMPPPPRPATPPPAATRR